MHCEGRTSNGVPPNIVGAACMGGFYFATPVESHAEGEQRSALLKLRQTAQLPLAGPSVDGSLDARKKLGKISRAEHPGLTDVHLDLWLNDFLVRFRRALNRNNRGHQRFIVELGVAGWAWDQKRRGCQQRPRAPPAVLKAN